MGWGKAFGCGIVSQGNWWCTLHLEIAQSPGNSLFMEEILLEKLDYLDDLIGFLLL